MHDLEPKKTAVAKKSTRKTPAEKTAATGESKKTTAAKKTAKKTAVRRPRSA
ncbi:hypothetical protein [Streptomyces sp. NPDC058291]|uniref:hypothetical protein n=1 Tax=Streptomyces sp. NPDC058291 TaxID=3346427 RepID=UPI0036ED88F2